MGYKFELDNEYSEFEERNADVIMIRCVKTETFNENVNALIERGYRRGELIINDGVYNQVMIRN